MPIQRTANRRNSDGTPSLPCTDRQLSWGAHPTYSFLLNAFDGCILAFYPSKVKGFFKKNEFLCLRRSSLCRKTGDEIEGADINRDEDEIEREIEPVGDPEDLLYLAIPKKIEGIGIDLKEIDLKEGIDEHHGKADPLAENAVKTKLGKAVGDKADRDDKEKGVRDDRIKILKEDQLVCKADARIGEEDSRAKDADDRRKIIEEAPSDDQRDRNEPAGDSAAGARQKDPKYLLQSQLVRQNKAVDTPYDPEQNDHGGKRKQNAVPHALAFSAEKKRGQNDKADAKEQNGNVKRPPRSLDLGIRVGTKQPFGKAHKTTSYK